MRIARALNHHLNSVGEFGELVLEFAIAHVDAVNLSRRKGLGGLDLRQREARRTLRGTAG
jgi:hypothetical protein